MAIPAAGDSRKEGMRRQIRCLPIGNRQIRVIDGLFSAQEVASLYAFLQKLRYRLDEIDAADTAYAPHWKVEFPPELGSGDPMFRRCVDLTVELLGEQALRLKRIHANLHLYGDMQFPHTDLIGGVTALYYANPDWDEKWMGETVFYDENREPLYAIAPKPGRIVIFDADIVHRGGVPSRECYRPRISVAFKFKRVSDQP